VTLALLYLKPHSTVWCTICPRGELGFPARYSQCQRGGRGMRSAGFKEETNARQSRREAQAHR
jgi:hypothetical protein